MDDRELLELAAKAIGAKADEQAADGTLYFGRAKWNPLTDDGDALRLAVELQLFDCGAFLKYRLIVLREDPSKSDYEIARRAIVLAAAEIGKQIAALTGEE